MDYGFIGNCNTGALVNKRASVEWMCFPEFDSHSCFAKILDEKKGGSFDIRPDRACEVTQRYMENTNILETIFKADDYKFRVIDFFPRYTKLLPNKTNKAFRQNRLIRIIEPLEGTPRMKILFDPKLDYARGETAVVMEDGSLVARKSEGEKVHELQLITNVDLQKIFEKDWLDINHRIYLVVGEKDDPEEFDVRKCLQIFRDTKKYWENWVETLILPDRNRDVIIRSALVLKLLTFSQTGAIIAAPTTSIPEEIGSPRTWDYRYCWVRDAAYCVDALKKVGRSYESKKLMDFIIDQVLKNDYIQAMYGLRGETRLTEKELKHLDGYKDTGPVRIGNAAYTQNQYDIYGEIIDILYLYFIYYKYEKNMTRKYWRFLKYVVNQIKFSWEKRDSGIWEFRDIMDHYTFSKFMCWVGVDRAIKIAQCFEKDDLVNEWLPLREQIRANIIENGYDQEEKAFTMRYDGKELDAALLLMTYHEFLEPTNPMLINTVKAIYRKLAHSDYLVKRYDMHDDFGKSKSAFTICSFWLIQAMYYIGENEKARKMYDRLMKKGNHLGLFSEDIDIDTKNLLGNFPQAYTHIAIINTSILLSEWDEKRKMINWEDIKRKTLF